MSYFVSEVEIPPYPRFERKRMRLPKRLSYAGPLPVLSDDDLDPEFRHPRGFELSLSVVEERALKKYLVPRVYRLLDWTHFTPTELYRIFLVYMRLTAKEYMTRFYFRDLLHRMFGMENGATTSRIYDLVLNDYPQRPGVEMDEFACLLSLFIMGSTQERVDFVRRVYNWSGPESMMSRSEVHKNVRRLMVDRGFAHPTKETFDFDTVAVECFDVRDKDNIDEREFVWSVRRSPLTVDALSQVFPKMSRILPFFALVSSDSGPERLSRLRAPAPPKRGVRFAEERYSAKFSNPYAPKLDPFEPIY